MTAEPSPTSFQYSMRVQFEHTDAQGRVFYASYFRLIDQARCAFWENLGLGEAAVRQLEQDTVIVHVEADYHGAAAFYDLLRISVWAEELGRSSLQLVYHIVNEQTAQEIFTARTVMVQVDLASERSRPWSPAFREVMIRHHGTQIVKA